MTASTRLAPARLRRRLAAALLAVAAVSGCASVPSESPVQILRAVRPTEPPQGGPVDVDDSLDLVRSFVRAGARSADGHGEARRFLAADAAPWDDAASLTVLGSVFDTVPVSTAPGTTPGAAVLRVRGQAMGRLSSIGAFEPERAPFQSDVRVRREPDGQWRIIAAPPGVAVPLPEFTDAYRAVGVWFTDPARGKVVPDLRYVPTEPASAQAGRIIELLLAGPSAAVDPAVSSELPAAAQLRGNVSVQEDGYVLVDLTRLGDLDGPARERLAAQVVLSLDEVDVTRVRLLADGAPLLPGRPDLSREDVGSLVGEVPLSADAPGLVVAGGRVRQLLGPEQGEPLTGQAGNGAFEVDSAALTLDGTRLAVVARQGGRHTLLVGAPGGGPDAELAAVPLLVDRLTRPSWTPNADEVWTVLDGRTVARVLLGEGPPRNVQADTLTGLGEITSLRLSRDGTRVAAAVGGALYVAAVVRSEGEVALRNVRRLTPVDFPAVTALDWNSSDSLVVISGGAEPQVATVSVDGLRVQSLPTANLTAPLAAVTAGPSRPMVVADANGLWSFGDRDQAAWQPVYVTGPGAVPLFPG